MEEKDLLNNFLNMFISLDYTITKNNNTNKTLVFSTKLKVLFLIYCLQGCSPKQLRERINIEKSNLTLLCKGMVENGLIAQYKNQSDKRFINYSITPKGKKLLENKLNQIRLNINSHLNEKNHKEAISLSDKINKLL